MGKSLDAAKTFLYVSAYRFWDQLHRKRMASAPEVRNAIAQVAHKGLMIVENYYTPEQCSRAREEIDRLIRDYDGSLYRPSGNESDTRVYGGEKVSEIVESFYRDPFLWSLTEEYHRAEIMNMATLAARIEAGSGNLGSGAGWHRDSVHIRQFKAIVYLSDVNESNGPFQYLEGSHTFAFINRLVREGLSGFDQSRYTPGEIDRVLRETNSEVSTLTASQGTLILVDTRGLHRGKPLVSGDRYAFTNYYYAKHHATRKQIKKFQEVLIDV